jgi:cytoskeletal protein CcmA (bactofilin family)
MFKKSGGHDAASQSGAPEEPCVLGATLKFKGVLSADEDLIIQATVEGAIAIPRRKLTIGEQGKVKADVQALQIIAEGTVEGDLHSEEAVIITKTADVSGNIFAPRISIENGATFNGRIEMQRKRGEKSSAKPEKQAAPEPVVEQTLEVVVPVKESGRR